MDMAMPKWVETVDRARVGHAPDTSRLGEDGRLVLLAREGNRSAQGALFRRHAADLTRLVTRLLSRTHDADDVVQDAFTVALTRLDSLEDPNTFRAWLFRIAIRKVHNTYRKRRLLASLGLDRGLDDATLCALAPSSTGTTRAELRLLDDALAKLPAPLRFAWMLRHVEGEKLEAIAEHTGWSLATVKRKLAKAEARVGHHTGSKP